MADRESQGGLAQASDPHGTAQTLAPAGSPPDFAQILGIADALPMPVALVDPQERYQFINAAFARFFERPRREILGRTIREVMGETAYTDREQLIRAGLSGERQWFAANFSHPTRGLLAIQTDYVPQVGPDGSVQGMIILVQDVSEQRVAERSLRESEARFRRIADSAPVLMWVTRLDRKRDFVNDAYAEFAGLSRNEARTHDWKDWIHPEDFDRIARDSVAGEASLEPFVLEGRFRRADGKYRWLRSVSRPRFGPDRDLIGYIGAAFDITAAKEAELELRALVDARTAELSERDARFRAIFDAVMEVVVLLDPKGTIIEINHTRAGWRHPDPSQSIGKPLWDSLTLDGMPQLRGAVRDAVARAAAGEVVREEVRLEPEGGVVAYVDVSIQPICDEHGELTFLLFEARDITELKGAQEQLRQSQKMEALGQLTGGIAHDFNNLLTVVVGGLDLIAKRAEDPKLQRYAVNALEAAERGARLTAQLLAFSRVQRLEVRPIYVTPLIENMRPLLRNVLGPSIEKTFDLDTDLIPVLGDPTQLELAVLNLAINARDAMPDGGTLRFRTTRRDIRADPELEDGEYLELTIGDTGLGMPADVVARAFDPFFTTKDVGKGTGLGLSMVYGVARQSGGIARIESVPGEGTCVRLLFRRAPDGALAADAPENAASKQRQTRPTERILVIDDDPDVRDFVVAGLEEFGYAVTEASDGTAGLKVWRESSPDLVVLDYLMPGLSGADVARAMLAERPDQPILFVSGYSETDAIRAAAPHAAILSKPFRTDGLDDAVRAALAARP